MTSKLIDTVEKKQRLNEIAQNTANTTLSSQNK